MVGTGRRTGLIGGPNKEHVQGEGVMDWWEAMRGRERARQEMDEAAKRTRQAQEKAQEAGLERSARDAAPKQPEAIQRAENEPRPGERAWPDHAERLRAMHDNPPTTQKPEQEREASRMEYTRTAQPAPSMGGTGVKFTNSRVKQPARDFADEVLEQAREILAAEDAAMTPEQRMDRDQRQAQDREQARERTLERKPERDFRGVWDSR